VNAYIDPWREAYAPKTSHQFSSSVAVSANVEAVGSPERSISPVSSRNISATLPVSESVSDQIGPVVAALEALAAGQSELAVPVDRLRTAAKLPQAPSAAELDALAAAVARVATAIGDLSL
jgi:hypothetical protein